MPPGASAATDACGAHRLQTSSTSNDLNGVVRPSRGIKPSLSNVVEEAGSSRTSPARSAGPSSAATARGQAQPERTSGASKGSTLIKHRQESSKHTKGQQEGQDRGGGTLETAGYWSTGPSSSARRGRFRHGSSLFVQATVAKVGKGWRRIDADVGAFEQLLAGCRPGTPRGAWKMAQRPARCRSPPPRAGWSPAGPAGHRPDSPLASEARLNRGPSGPNRDAAALMAKPLAHLHHGHPRQPSAKREPPQIEQPTCNEFPSLSPRFQGRDQGTRRRPLPPASHQGQGPAARQRGGQLQAQTVGTAAISWP